MKKIIDISQWQGVIDWQEAKKHIDGAIIRAGYGSNEAPQDDRYFGRNCDECERLDIPYEVYIYSYAFTDAMARSEAAHVLRLVKGRKVSRIWYDVEENGSGKTAKACLFAFAEAVRAAGYDAGLYTYESFYNAYLQGVTAFPVWIAKYSNKEPQIGADYIAWQYTNGEAVGGISGAVDCSRWYGDFAKKSEPVKATVKTVYRLYKAARHFYTTDEKERKALAAAGWTDEGKAWKAPVNGHPVYRYVNGRDHIWTAEEKERKALAAAGWIKEGIAFRSNAAETVPVFRLYSTNTGDRVYTKDKNEKKALAAAGWRDEGTAFYGRK